MRRMTLTIDTTLPMQAEGYGRRLAGRASDIDGFLGVFTSASGVLNQVILLQEGEISCEPPSVPDDIVIHDRQVQAFRTYRPYRADDGQPLYDLRCYDVAFGKGALYADLMRDIMPVREKHSLNHGLWLSTTGRSDQILHLWGYQSFEHREEIRKRVFADADWLPFGQKILPMLVGMKSTFVAPVRLAASAASES